MAAIDIEDKNINTALFQFIFPFSIKSGSERKLMDRILADGFTPFYLNDLKLETAYYGDKHAVSHKQMERYYLPFTGQILFPHELNHEAFRRFSQANGMDCTLESPNRKTEFRILSTDVIVCPFELGFITVRTEITEQLAFSEAMEFAARFRVMENVSRKDDFTSVHCDNKQYEQVENFIFNLLVPGVLPFLDETAKSGAYFETLPFFVDERMYVQAFYGFDESVSLTMVDQYCALQLDGLNVEGHPYISANSMEYITYYCNERSYQRWSPETVYLTNEYTFCCLTTAAGSGAVPMANQMYGEYYYGLLLNLFHKIVLLKLSNRYSHVRMEKDNDEIEGLIRSITKFSAKYYFLELVSQSQGKEIFVQLRTIFGNNELFVEVKETLTDLYKYQDRIRAKGQNSLLMILTLYTVVGGIYGMNQVIEDLKGHIDWSKMLKYSIFEYIALFLTFTGILVGFGLMFIVLYKWIKGIVRSRKEPDGF